MSFLQLLGFWVEEPNPLKQGLKHKDIVFVSHEKEEVEEPNPLKQGLKPILEGLIHFSLMG